MNPTHHSSIAIVFFVAGALAVACGGGAKEDSREGQTAMGVTCAADAADQIADYMDDLDKHPGCDITDNTADDLRPAVGYTPAKIPGYKCLAKDYSTTPGFVEDTKKPIVLLIHGNSDWPGSWEKCQAGTLYNPPTDCPHTDPMLADQLVDKGFRTFAIDMRFDKVCHKHGGPDSCGPSDNPSRNFDHGWAVPLVQHFIRATLEAYPDRELSVVSMSLGVTVTRDALRRLACNDGFNPYPRIKDLVLASGGNHGVSTYDAGFCEQFPGLMKGTAVCELGSRANYVPTVLGKPLGGPGQKYEVPCSDGETAYGAADACGGHKVAYSTIVMEDLPDGTFKDGFVSQASSGLRGATNLTVSVNSVDTSGYLYSLLANHFGSVRSPEGVDAIVRALSD